MNGKRFTTIEDINITKSLEELNAIAKSAFRMFLKTGINGGINALYPMRTISKGTI